jgi:HK97 family phage prohead protease
MPWHASEEHDNRCPVDKPWAVILDKDGSVVQCHETKVDAETAVRALYTNVEEKGDSKMETKMAGAEFKALEAEGRPGTFSAKVAVYGNVDKKGDRIVDGAFDATLRDWQAKGDPIPIILHHDWNNPFAHIGYVMPDKVKSVPGVGLVVEEAVLDIDDNPAAAQVYRLMERKSLKEFSFGYTVPKGGMVRAPDGAFDLKALNLIEVGPCLRGVNDKTELLSIKAQLDANDRDFTIEERVSRLEATLEAQGVKAKADGPPVEAYDPEKAKASMVVTGKAFMEKVNEQPAVDAMGEAIKAIQAVPGATPKPEFAGTKALDPDQAPETAKPEGYDSVRVINSMVAQAREFITNEEDAEDIKTMEDVITALEALATKEEAEGSFVAAEVTAAPAEAKSMNPEVLSRELSTMSLESELRQREADLEIKEVLSGGKADSTFDRLKVFEDSLS